MVCPLWLCRQQGLQDQEVLVLPPGGLQQLDHLSRALVKRRIPNDQPYPGRILLHEIFHDRIESAAGFTRGIEEFDNCHGRLAGTDDRRMHAHQPLRLLGGLLPCLLCTRLW